MAVSDTKAPVPPGSRNVYGPRAVGTLIPALTRPAFRRLGPAAARLIADWEAIVGPGLAAAPSRGASRRAR